MRIYIHKIIAAIVALLIFANGANSQNAPIKFDKFDVTDGLSSNTVHCFAQDDKGFLWIGTHDGLNRFDGNTFITFKKDLKNPLSISDNEIRSLYIDTKDVLWIGTSSGLNKYDKISNQFKAFKTFEFEGKNISFQTIYAITEDTKGHIWLGSFSGLFEFDPSTEKIVSQYHFSKTLAGLSDNEIRSLFMDDNDVLWIGTNAGGLNRFDIRKKTFSHFMNQAKEINSIGSNSVGSILRDRSGNLWIGTSWGLDLMDEGTETFKHFYNNTRNSKAISAIAIYSIYEDHFDNLWIGTLNGLGQFDKKKKIFKNWESDLSKNDSYFKIRIFALFEDNFGQFWIGSSNKGIAKFNNKYKNFNYLLLDEANSIGFSDNAIIREIYQDDKSKIWIGVVNRGLYIYNPTDGQINTFKNDPTNSKSLSENRVNTVFIDSKENIWVGTWEGGLNRAKPYNDTYYFEHFYHNPSDSSSIGNNVIKEIVEDHWGRIWLGTENGLDLFDPYSKKAIHFIKKENDLNSLPDNNIQSGCILFDKQNNMWLGTWNGLSKVVFSPKTKMPQKFINYFVKDTAQISLSNNRVISLCFGKNNMLYAGTHGGGLNKIKLDENLEITDIKHFSEEEGLDNSIIYTIVEDENGFLWLSTNNGLSKFNPITDKFENYDESDGLLSSQFFWGSGCKLNSGEFAFGSFNGLCTFFPSEIHQDSIVPEMVITDIKIFNHQHELKVDLEPNKNFVYTDTIFLDHTSNGISFEFAGLQFANPTKNKYAYKLEGYNKQWINTDAKNRFAIYTNLAPKEYTFMVKGSNADGVWNEKYASIKLIVVPPYWKTWWFILFATLFFLGSLYGLYWLRIEALRKQNKYLENIVKEKTLELVIQNEKLQDSNEELHLQSEELETLNEELTSLNEELYGRQEELNNTIKLLNDTQKQLIQSEKMASIGILASGVAHEINNPLNFIQGGIYSLQNYFKENLESHWKKVSTFFDIMQTGISRSSNIITSLNHYSEQSDRPQIECNIHSIIDDCLVLLQNETTNRIEILKKYDSKQPFLFCNEGQLHQALLNVLLNAVHAIDDKGTIIINTQLMGKNFLIAISDSGNGIKEDDINKIFNPFFTTKDPGKGAGLGLSITYNIIKEHLGNIEISSKPGEGTKVVISLPLS